MPFYPGLAMHEIALIDAFEEGEETNKRKSRECQDRRHDLCDGNVFDHRGSWVDCECHCHNYDPAGD